MLRSAIFLALSIGALAQTEPGTTDPVVTVPAPAESTGEIALAPFEETAEEAPLPSVEGPALTLEGCPADGVINPVDEPKPQYYLNFGSYPTEPLDGWTAIEDVGIQVPGVTFTGNLGVARYPLSKIVGTSDRPCIQPQIYQTEMFGRGAGGWSIAFKVAENVQYDIVMHFAENYLAAPETAGQFRSFDIQVNGATQLAQLNILQSSGVFTAVTKELPSVVGQQDQIVVNLVPIAGSEPPLMNAIEVFPTAEFRSGEATPAVDRNTLLAAMFADFYSLLGANELVDAADPAAAVPSATGPV